MTSQQEKHPAILFVDDEIHVLRALKRDLATEPLTIHIAESGDDALKILETTKIDLVVSDERMPGMKGSQLLGHVKRRHPDVCRIMLTGHADLDAAMQAINQGRIQKFLLKPVSHEKLIQAIQTTLEEHRESETILSLSQQAGGVCSFEVTFPNEGPPRIRWSENARLLLGLSPESPLNSLDVLYQRVHPEDLDRVRHLNQGCLNSQTCPLAEYRLVPTKGEPRWISQTSARSPASAGFENRLFSVLKDITETKQQSDRLEYLAYHDALTGLGNRAQLLRHLQRMLEEQPERTTALLFIDLDNFKLVNDSMGHPFGDWLLVDVADRLAAVRPPEALVARFGGDEFALALVTEDSAMAVETANAIHKSLAPPFIKEDMEVHVTASIGIALAKGKTGTPNDLLREADTAMYQAKKRSRGSTMVFDNLMHDKASAYFKLVGDMHRGLDSNEFFLAYQPIINLNDLRLTGFEALCRWQHPKRDLVMPGEFIPVAEESGLITRLGTWVMDQACRQARKWRDSSGFISFNVSVHQLRQVGLAERLRDNLARYELSPDRLKVEVTESGLMDDVKTSLRVLDRIRAMGVRIQIDDFGTGYSSLRYLQRIPADSLKVDQSFVRNLEDSEESKAIVKTIVDLARSLGLTVVAEGVETPGQLAQLRELGCHQVQGFFFDRPLPPDQAEARDAYDHLLGD